MTTERHVSNTWSHTNLFGGILGTRGKGGVVCILSRKRTKSGHRANQHQKRLTHGSYSSQRPCRQESVSPCVLETVLVLPVHLSTAVETAGLPILVSLLQCQQQVLVGALCLCLGSLVLPTGWASMWVWAARTWPVRFWRCGHRKEPRTAALCNLARDSWILLWHLWNVQFLMAAAIARLLVTTVATASSAFAACSGTVYAHVNFPCFWATWVSTRDSAFSCAWPVLSPRTGLAASCHWSRPQWSPHSIPPTLMLQCSLRLRLQIDCCWHQRIRRCLAWANWHIVVGLVCVPQEQMGRTIERAPLPSKNAECVRSSLHPVHSTLGPSHLELRQACER